MIVVPQLAFHGAAVAAGSEPTPLGDSLELVRRGARELSLLDLDGDVAADGEVPLWLKQIVEHAGVPVRIDARLHDGRRIDALSRIGFDTVVVDVTAVFDAMLLRWSLDLFGKRACFEVQVDGPYLFEAPEHAYATELVDVVDAMHLQGVRRLLVRDVAPGAAPPLTQLAELGTRLPNTAITYQGAARTIQDVTALAQLGRVLEAVLVDARAVLGGDLDLAAANRVVHA